MRGPGASPVLGAGVALGVGVVVAVAVVTGMVLEGGREVVDAQMLKCLSTVPLGPQISQ